MGNSCNLDDQIMIEISGVPKRWREGVYQGSGVHYFEAHGLLS